MEILTSRKGASGSQQMGDVPRSSGTQSHSDHADADLATRLDTARKAAAAGLHNAWDRSVQKEN